MEALFLVLISAMLLAACTKGNEPGPGPGHDPYGPKNNLGTDDLIKR